MDYKAFAERTKHKTFDELVHEGRHRAQELLEDQGIIYNIHFDAVSTIIPCVQPSNLVSLLAGRDMQPDSAK